jgi:hypothetical protein
MTLIKKSEVEMHRSARAAGKVLPFGSRALGNTTGHSASGATSEKSLTGTAEKVKTSGRQG